MLEQAPAWSLFKAGLFNSLILVAGALIATFCFAVLLAAGLASTWFVPRLLVRTIILTMQSSPIVLTLVIAAAVSHAFFAYSGAMALGGGLGWVLWSALSGQSWGDVGDGSRWLGELAACIFGCAGWLLVSGWWAFCRE